MSDEEIISSLKCKVEELKSENNKLRSCISDCEAERCKAIQELSEIKRLYQSRIDELQTQLEHSKTASAKIVNIYI